MRSWEDQAAPPKLIRKGRHLDKLSEASFEAKPPNVVPELWTVEATMQNILGELENLIWMACVLQTLALNICA
eukprot:2252881-Amphidinium_carterae.1